MGTIAFLAIPLGLILLAAVGIVMTMVVSEAGVISVISLFILVFYICRFSDRFRSIR